MPKDIPSYPPSENDPLVEGCRHQIKKTQKEYLKGVGRQTSDSIDISELNGGLFSAMDKCLEADPEETYFFFNEAKLRANVELLREHFLPDMPDRRRIIYAMKANPKSKVMKVAADAGIDGFDCATYREIEKASNYVPPSGLFFNHPIKKLNAVKRADKKSVRYFTVQSRSGIENVLKGTFPAHEGDLPEIVIRLQTPNPDARIDLSTAKYGASEKEAREMLRYLNNQRVNAFSGLSMNVGSQNTNPEAFAHGIEYMTRIAKEEGGVCSINVGGGIPVNYFEDDNFDRVAYLQRISQSIRDNLEGVFSQNAIEPKIIIEPGRCIVADTIDLVIPILERKDRENSKGLYIGDGIFRSFSDSVIHRDWRYSFNVIPKDGRITEGEEEMFNLYGESCDTGDQLIGVSLPADVREGDHLWVRNAGAYMSAQASDFNSPDPSIFVPYNSKS
ncbi:hypothetical protein JW758_04295 [Candidatus Peregrinibacteria bacterium]|nr:hypothetical protein [Candidatus Peregrinibacteria bacterium]